MEKNNGGNPAIQEICTVVLSDTEMLRTYKVGHTTYRVKSIFDTEIDYATLLYQIVRGKMRDYE